MRLSKRKFNKIVKVSWESLRPAPGEMPHYYSDNNKLGFDTRLPNYPAVIAFCLLFTSLFFVSSESQLSIDLNVLNNKKVVSYISSISISEEKK